jgi:hypothetical protein
MTISYFCCYFIAIYFFQKKLYIEECIKMYELRLIPVCTYVQRYKHVYIYTGKHKQLRHILFSGTSKCQLYQVQLSHICTKQKFSFIYMKYKFDYFHVHPVFVDLIVLKSLILITVSHAHFPVQKVYRTNIRYILLRPNSLTKSRQKFQVFSSLLFTDTSTAFP